MRKKKREKKQKMQNKEVETFLLLYKASVIDRLGRCCAELLHLHRFHRRLHLLDSPLPAPPPGVQAPAQDPPHLEGADPLRQPRLPPHGRLSAVLPLPPLSVSLSPAQGEMSVFLSVCLSSPAQGEVSVFLSLIAQGEVTVFLSVCLSSPAQGEVSIFLSACPSSPAQGEVSVCMSVSPCTR